jgi:hypothetical protein
LPSRAPIIGTSPGILGTAERQQHLRSILAFCNAPRMKSPEAYVQITEGLITVLLAGRRCAAPGPGLAPTPLRMPPLSGETRHAACRSGWSIRSGAVPAECEIQLARSGGSTSED